MIKIVVICRGTDWEHMCVYTVSVLPDGRKGSSDALMKSYRNENLS